MSNIIKAEELTDILQDYLENYRENIDEDVKECTKITIKGALTELKNTSPVSDTDVILKGGEVHKKGDYAKGWAIKTPTKGAYRYYQVVWNKTNYRLTHLLEFGHVKRNGTGWVDAQPHIRDIEKTYGAKFIDLLQERIRKRQ